MKENQIYTTTDYDSFEMKNGNRSLDTMHVRRIAENMEQNGWVGSPIEVSFGESGKYQIEDGQHRYMAAKVSHLPIKFMVVKPMAIYDIAMMNSIKKGWTGKDYVKAYAEDGNYNYKRLKNLTEEFPKTTLSDITEVIGDGRGMKRINLQKGHIRITDEQFYTAREILKSLVMFNESLDNIGVKTKHSYKKEMIRLLKNNLIDPERMIDKMDKHGKMILPPSATRQQALYNLQVLYNYHMPKDKCVFFQDKLAKR